MSSRRRVSKKSSRKSRACGRNECCYSDSSESSSCSSDESSDCSDSSDCDDCADCDCYNRCSRGQRRRGKGKSKARSSKPLIKPPKTPSSAKISRKKKTSHRNRRMSSTSCTCSDCTSYSSDEDCCKRPLKKNRGKSRCC